MYVSRMGNRIVRKCWTSCVRSVQIREPRVSFGFVDGMLDVSDVSVWLCLVEVDLLSSRGIVVGKGVFPGRSLMPKSRVLDNFVLVFSMM